MVIQMAQNNKKITKLTNDDKDRLLSKTPFALPDNPSSKGYSSAQVKQKMYAGYLCLFEMLKRSLDEADTIINDNKETLESINSLIENLNGDIASINDILSSKLPLSERAEKDVLGRQIDSTYATNDSLNNHSELINALDFEIENLKNDYQNVSQTVEQLGSASEGYVKNADIASNKNDLERKLATLGQVKTLIADLVSKAPETLDTLSEIADKIAEMEGDDSVFRTLINDLANSRPTFENMESELALKADKSNTYTKAEIDNAYLEKTSIPNRVYIINSEGEQTVIPYSDILTDGVSSLLMRNENGLANVSNPVNPYNIANKNYVDTKISELPNVPTYRGEWNQETTYNLGDWVSSVNDNILYVSLKADNTNHTLGSTTWWRSRSAYATKASKDGSGNTITSTYATIDYVNSKVNGRFIFVNSLPETGETNAIYLVSKANGSVNNDSKDEYIWVVGESNGGRWEKVGNTQVTLDGYATIAMVQQLNIGRGSGYQSIIKTGASESSGTGSVALGTNSAASGNEAIAAGHHTTAQNDRAVAFGLETITDRPSQLVVGDYNDSATKSLFVVGCGNESVGRKNAFTVNIDGTVSVRNGLIVNARENSNKGYVLTGEADGKLRFNGELYAKESDLSNIKTISIVRSITPLVNINGKALSLFSTSLHENGGIFPYYSVHLSNLLSEPLSEEDSKRFLKAFTGSEYLPIFNFDRPEHSYILDSDLNFYKVQWSESEGMRLYVMSPLKDKTLPSLPSDNTKNYVLKCIGGVVQWVEEQ